MGGSSNRTCRVSVFWPGNPLPHGGLADQERAGDLPGLHPPSVRNRQSPLGVDAQRRVAGGEEQAEQIVVTDRVEVFVDGCHRVLLVSGARGLELGQQRDLAVEVSSSPVLVDREVLGGCHQPGGWAVGDPVARPLPECSFEGVLGEILGRGEVPGDPGQRGDKAA